ncbi:MAG: hypothetical protein H6922_04190 [Pseudomonadaceae bacterium]|nr:hypothetical protein [Pseudomonadaceae bacterium]
MNLIKLARNRVFTLGAAAVTLLSPLMVKNLGVATPYKAPAAVEHPHVTHVDAAPAETAAPEFYITRLPQEYVVINPQKPLMTPVIPGAKAQAEFTPKSTALSLPKPETPSIVVADAQNGTAVPPLPRLADRSGFASRTTALQARVAKPRPAETVRVIRPAHVPKAAPKPARYMRYASSQKSVGSMINCAMDPTCDR